MQKDNRADQRGAGAMRRMMHLCALLLLAPLMALMGSPAHAADQVGVPSGSVPSGYAKIIVKKGGDRTATGVSALAGARFRFYSTNSSTDLSHGIDTGLTCTTDASGQCGVIVRLASTYNYFYAAEEAAPAGWSISSYWGNTYDYVRYNTGLIKCNESQAVRTLPRPENDGAERTWPDERANNVAPQRCGLDVAMIFDVSNSIDASERAKFQAAGRGAVDALTNTASRIALSKFDSNASAVLPLTSVSDAAGASAVKNAISGMSGRGGNYGATNWDQALWINANPDYDVVLMLTDGDPTVSRNGIGPGSHTTIREVEEAIHSANAVKAAGAQVITVGIGMTGRDSIHRLNQISSVNDTYTTSWDQLAGKLKEIAAGLCNQKITVQKKVVDAQGNPAASALSNGWNFTGSATGGTVGTFPATAQVNGTDGFTSADLTVGTGATPTITLEEATKPGWTFSDAACWVDGAPVQVTADTTKAGRFSFVGKANAATSCVVTNKQTSPEVLPEQRFGKAKGKVKASCQGTVRAKLMNRSGKKVTYTLRIGKKVYKIKVKTQTTKKFTTSGPFKAKVVLKVGKRKVVAKTRIPARCSAPDVLPNTGMKPTAARQAVVTRRWSL